MVCHGQNIIFRNSVNMAALFPLSATSICLLGSIPVQAQTLKVTGNGYGGQNQSGIEADEYL